MEGAAEEFWLHLPAPEISRPRADRLADARARDGFPPHWVLPIRAKVADVHAGRGVHDQNASVAVAVGNSPLIPIRRLTISKDPR